MMTGLGLVGLLGVIAPACGAVPLVQLAPAEAGRMVEFRGVGVPSAANPFDDELIRVDATFVGPDERAWTVPGFWYQGYTRRLSNGAESLTPQGAAEWRVRFTPTATGEFRATLTATWWNWPSRKSGPAGPQTCPSPASEVERRRVT